MLRLATRGSPLALVQARIVADRLTAAHPGLDVSTVVVRTTGDRRAEVSLDRLGGQGAFVIEVEEAVRDGRVEVAVHSAKDLPSTGAPDLLLAVVPERGTVRDALVGQTLADLVPGVVVATGSVRRRAQLANLRPDLTFADLRGNMATRIAWVGADSASRIDAVVVACAAMVRLEREAEMAEVLSVAAMLPQVGQGALALECRGDDAPTAALLATVDDAACHAALVAERAFLAAMGGDCSTPVAAHGTWDAAGTLTLEGLVASEDGRLVVRERRRVAGSDAAALGASVAAALIDCGGDAVLASTR